MIVRSTEKLPKVDESRALEDITFYQMGDETVRLGWGPLRLTGHLLAIMGPSAPVKVRC